MKKSTYSLIKIVAERMAYRVYNDTLKTARDMMTDYSLSLFNAYTPKLIKMAYRKYPQYFQNSNTVYFKKKGSDDWIYTIPAIVDEDIPAGSKIEITENEFNPVKLKIRLICQ